MRRTEFIPCIFFFWAAERESGQELPSASELVSRPPAGAWIATIIGEPVLKKSDCRIGGLRRLVGVKPEVVQCAPANRVRVLILCKRFRVPGYGTSTSE